MDILSRTSTQALAVLAEENASIIKENKHKNIVIVFNKSLPARCDISINIF